MVFVNLVGSWHVFLIKAIIPRLIATNQEHRPASRIERKEDSVWSTFVLNNQFLHICMPGSYDRSYMWTPEARPLLFQDSYHCCNVLLLCLVQIVPPRLEFIGILNLPCHIWTIPYVACNVKCF